MHNINIEEDGGLLPALQKYMKMIVIPQINKYDKWGSLMENKQGKLFDRPNSFSGPYIFVSFNQGSEHKKSRVSKQKFRKFWTLLSALEILEFSSSQQLSSQLVWNRVNEWIVRRTELRARNYYFLFTWSYF